MTDINIDGIVTWLQNWFQDKLVSGTNIKTINDQSLLGSGNINISGGGSVTVDDALSTTSENPVQNKVITGELNNKSATGHTHDDRYYTETELKFTQKQSLQSGKILVFANAFMVHVILTGTFSSLTANGVTTLSNTTINATYRPKYSSAVWGNGDGRFGAVSVTSAGAIKIVNNSSATSLNIHTSVTYPLASAMP